MSSTFRPRYHFSPSSGWINDPNGLVYVDGVWHLFFQFMPTQVEWGPMHWGHATSRDLTSWEHRPIALYPDSLGTIFSGSAAVHGSTDEGIELVACFTHANGSEPQVQSLAFSQDHGDTWTKYPGNPILRGDRHDFRDPKIFRHEHRWIMVLAAAFEAQIFASDDLVNWELQSTFPAPDPTWVWECPDLIEIDGSWVLIVSFVRESESLMGAHRAFYWVGDFDGTRFTAESDMLPLGFGPDDYATVSWNNTPDDRRVVIGWMSTWPYAGVTPTADEGWRGAMTIPRELTLSDGRLLQQQPAELLARRGSAVPFDENGTAFRGDSYEIEAQIDLAGLVGTQVGFRLRVAESEETVVGYDTAQGEVFIDRRNSGQTSFHPRFAGRFSAPYETRNQCLKLRIFVDRCSVEVFVGEGELYGAALIFPAPESLGIEFFGDGARVLHGNIYDYATEV